MVAAPFYHMNALGTAKTVLAAHASMVLLPQFRAPAYIEAIARYRGTWISGVPTMLALRARGRPSFSPRAISPRWSASAWARRRSPSR